MILRGFNEKNITKHQISSPLALSHMVASTGWPFNGQQQRPATMAIFVQPQVVADPLDLAQRSRFARASARWSRSRSQRGTASARRRQAIYPPWQLGPQLRFSWRLETRPKAQRGPERRHRVMSNEKSGDNFTDFWTDFCRCNYSYSARKCGGNIWECQRYKYQSSYPDHQCWICWIHQNTSKITKAFRIFNILWIIHHMINVINNLMIIIMKMPNVIRIFIFLRQFMWWISNFSLATGGARADHAEFRAFEAISTWRFFEAAIFGGYLSHIYTNIYTIIYIYISYMHIFVLLVWNSLKMYKAT